MHRLTVIEHTVNSCINNHVSDLSGRVSSLFALEIFGTFETFVTFEIFEIFEFLDNVIFSLIARKRFNNGLTLSNFIVTTE